MIESKLSARLAFLLIMHLLLGEIFVKTAISRGHKSGHNGTSKTPSSSSQVPRAFDYGNYVEKFKKNYGPTETLNRARLFFSRTLMIFKHNILFKRQIVNYYLSQNQFTDMTAAELRTNYLAHGIDMQPLVEALKKPYLPADQLPSVCAFKNGDDYSRASLDDLAKGVTKTVNNRSPILDFMDDQGPSNLKISLSDIKSEPDLARKFDQIVGLPVRPKAEEERAKSVYNNVKYSATVASNNRNYDPTLITSYGVFEAFEDFGENYARNLMESDFDIAPYPRPREPKHKVLKESESEDRDGSSLLTFMGSVKSIFDFFEFDKFDEEIDDEVPNEAPTHKTYTAEINGLKYDIDWRSSGCITVPKAQKSCNSCYAQATLALMEFFHCRQTKKLTDFSAQYIIDCGSKSSLNGCKGGKISQVGQFIKKYGIELNSMYPYTGKESQCPYDSESDRKKKAGYLRPSITHWQHFTDMVAWYKWLPKSPIIVGINMPKDFMGYGGGIHDGLDCDASMVHAMLLVGSGQENGNEFWLLKNSFSDAWGEGGYYRLSKSAPLRCFNSAIVARANFKVVAN